MIQNKKKLQPTIAAKAANTIKNFIFNKNLFKFFVSTNFNVCFPREIKVEWLILLANQNIYSFYYR